MAVGTELGRLSQQTTTEPGTMSLPLVRDNLNFQATRLSTTAANLTGSDASIDQLLDISLQAATEVLVQGTSAGKNNVLVETTTHIDRGSLNDVVDHGGKGREEVGAVNFGVEEDLGSEETLVSDVDGDLTATRVKHRVLDEAGGVPVVSGELLDNIGADVAVLLLNLLGRLERRVRLASITQQRLHEVGQVATCDGDRLDGGSNDVSLSDRDDVGNTVTRVNDRTGQRSVVDLGRGP